MAKVVLLRPVGDVGHEYLRVTLAEDLGDGRWAVLRGMPKVGLTEQTFRDSFGIADQNLGRVLSTMPMSVRNTDPVAIAAALAYTFDRTPQRYYDAVKGVCPEAVDLLERAIEENERGALR